MRREARRDPWEPQCGGARTGRGGARAAAVEGPLGRAAAAAAARAAGSECGGADARRSSSCCSCCRRRRNLDPRAPDTPGLAMVSEAEGPPRLGALRWARRGRTPESASGLRMGGVWAPESASGPLSAPLSRAFEPRAGRLDPKRGSGLPKATFSTRWVLWSPEGAPEPSKGVFEPRMEHLDLQRVRALGPRMGRLVAKMRCLDSRGAR